jgi:hypothetical protein
VNVQNDHKGTPLLTAAEYGHLECVRALLNAGAEIDAQDDDGADACVVACICVALKNCLTFLKLKFNTLLWDPEPLKTHFSCVICGWAESFPVCSLVLNRSFMSSFQSNLFYFTTHT